MIDLPAFRPPRPQFSLAALAACVLLGSPATIAQTPSAASFFSLMAGLLS